jgi:hypothetical protein
MPSLRPVLAAGFDKTYARAIADAADETGLPEADFPQRSPFSLDQALDPGFLPEPPAG